MSVAAPTFNVLSLCAGGGGLDLGVRLALRNTRTVCYVENEVTACGVLAARMEDGGLDDAPLWTDLRTFDGRPWRGVVDLVTGGYPCQPFSNAGKRLGADDPRHLWPEVERVVREVEPEWCFFENVGAHLRLGFREVAGSLHGMGYRVAATLLTASEVGAPHGRERLFILAHRDQQYGDGGGGAGARRGHEPANGSECVADSGRSAGRPRAEQGSASSGQEGADWPRQPSSQLADAERSSGSAEPRLEHQERAEKPVSAACANRGICRCLPDTGDVSGTLSSSGESDGAGRGAAASASGECDGTCVEHASCLGWGEGRPESVIWSGRDSATGAGSAVGRADIPRLEGRLIALDGSADEWLAWPPGPTDADAWRRVIAARPDLAPAVEPEIRGMADGLAGGLGRSDQLHILGNGVVPQQAAYAMTMLIDALTAKE